MMKLPLLGSLFASMVLASHPLSAAGVITTSPGGAKPTGYATHPQLSNLKTLASEFAKNFPGPFTSDTTHSESLGSSSVPQMKSGDLILNDTSVVNNFTERTNAYATIFAKVGKDFITVASSFRKSDGTSTLGVALDKTNLAYRNFVNGSSFSGMLSLYGKEYQIESGLFRDKTGQVVGAYIVGLPV